MTMVRDASSKVQIHLDMLKLKQRVDEDALKRLVNLWTSSFSILLTGWHYCDIDGRQATFLCPNGTQFSQAVFVCDWWFNVPCDLSPKLYSLNARLYQRPKTSTPPMPHRIISKVLIDEMFNWRVVGEETFFVDRWRDNKQDYLNNLMDGMFLFVE